MNPALASLSPLASLLANMDPHLSLSEFAEESSLNPLTIVERALRVFPSLEKVVILERLPRVDDDHLSELSEYSNFVLRQAVESSPLKDKITVVAHKSLMYSTNERMVGIFGPPASPGSDGIHLRGRLGTQLYTDSFINAIKESGIAGWSNSSSSRGTSNNVSNNNRFNLLN